LPQCHQPLPLRLLNRIAERVDHPSPGANRHSITRLDQMPDDVHANKARTTNNQYSSHPDFLRFRSAIVEVLRCLL
jgi:hypothetical protein